MRLVGEGGEVFGRIARVGRLGASDAKPPGSGAPAAAVALRYLK